MRPVQPGWVAVPVHNSDGNEWFHVVGWTEENEPVIAGDDKGIAPWSHTFGEDPFIIATLEEWTGAQHRDGTSDV
jgi:hypothetical protein